MPGRIGLDPLTRHKNAVVSGCAAAKLFAAIVRRSDKHQHMMHNRAIAWLDLDGA